MANEVLIKSGTPIIVADATDWPGGGAHGYGDDDYQIDLTSLANGAARQSAKIDLGATRGGRFAVRAAIEWASAPASTGVVVEFWWSASRSSTAGTGNDGGASGSDGAYQAGSETEWKRQLIPIGNMVATADGAGTVQLQTIATDFLPPERYGQLILVNSSGQAFDSDAANMFVALIPLIDEIQ